MLQSYTREDFMAHAPVDTDALRFVKSLPKGMAALLADYDKALIVAEEAAMAREDAEAAIDTAEMADLLALQASLRAGQDDPGMDATVAAHRAAIVSQERLRIALADLGRAEDKVVESAKANGEALLTGAAEAEIRRLDAIDKELALVHQAVGKVATLASPVGSTFAEVAYYLSVGDEAAILNPNWPSLAEISAAARNAKAWYEFRLRRLAESPAGSLS
jgi:hypothetical protein